MAKRMQDTGAHEEQAREAPEAPVFEFREPTTLEKAQIGAALKPEATPEQIFAAVKLCLTGWESVHDITHGRVQPFSQGVVESCLRRDDARALLHRHFGG